MIPREPFTAATAQALHLRLHLGWSTLDEDGHERSIPRRKDRRGHELPRKAPADSSWIPAADDLFRMFTAHQGG